MALAFLASCHGDPSNPQPVTNLVAASTSTTVTLTWTNPPDSYWGVRIRRAEGSTPPATITAGDGGVDVGNKTTWTDTGLDPSASYSYTAFVYGADGYYSTGVSLTVGTTAPETVPGAPTSPVATAGDASASVSWTAPASDGGSVVTGYVVTPYIGAVAQTPVIFSSTETTQDVTGLTNGTAYTFKVAAINAVGTGSQSAASNSVTPATVPGAPTVVDRGGRGRVGVGVLDRARLRWWFGGDGLCGDAVHRGGRADHR